MSYNCAQACVSLWCAAALKHHHPTDDRTMWETQTNQSAREKAWITTEKLQPEKSYFTFEFESKIKIRPQTKRTTNTTTLATFFLTFAVWSLTFLIDLLQESLLDELLSALASGHLPLQHWGSTEEETSETTRTGRKLLRWMLTELSGSRNESAAAAVSLDLLLLPALLLCAKEISCDWPSELCAQTTLPVHWSSDRDAYSPPHS